MVSFLIPFESALGETRVSATPETVKKFLDLGCKVFFEKGAGIAAGFLDIAYLEAGAELVEIENNEVKKIVDIVLCVQPPDEKFLSHLKQGCFLIGLLNPYGNTLLSETLKLHKISAISLELLPRISRAQSSDALSSQANIAGYKSVLLAASALDRYFPMLMTAAGTIQPSKVVVLGAGVAGLQAIATAKRLGGIVSATDVRAAVKEQVESLGGRFLSVEGVENLETEGGYAKEAGEDFRKKQEELLKNSIKKSDIVICTALIPGKKAPRIISEDMVKSMKPGSVVYDLAVAQGGNSAFSEADKVNIVGGVKVMGAKNILNNLPVTASNLYAKNLFNFVNNLYDNKKKDIHINKEDEIISKTLINKEL